MLEGYLLKQKLSEQNTVTCHKQPAYELALFYPHQGYQRHYPHQRIKHRDRNL